MRREKLTTALCIFSLFIMLFVYMQEDDLTGEQIINIKPSYKYEIGGIDGKQQVYVKEAKSTNLFLSKKGFFRHTECFVDNGGAGYCGWVFGPGDNNCMAKSSKYYECNHLECINKLCFAVAGKGDNTCSAFGEKC